MAGMDITIHACFLPHDDPEASLGFYRDLLGFEVRADVEYGGMHWITVGPPGQPGTSLAYRSVDGMALLRGGEVDAARAHPDERLAGPGDRVRAVADVEHLGRPGTRDPNCAHAGGE